MTGINPGRLAELRERARLGTMTHAELVKAISEACYQRRLWHAVTVDSPRNRPGWVDIVILGRGRACFVEVKTETGRRTRAQVDAEREITTAGLWYRLWRPSDLVNGTIDAELDNIA